MANPTPAWATNTAELSDALSQVNLAPGSSGAFSSSTEVVDNNGGDVDVAPSYGAMSIYGLSRASYDTYTATVDLCCPAIANHRPLHFFAIYHGNLGAQVSSLCKYHMHLHLGRQLGIDDQQNAGGRATQARWTAVLENTFQKMDEEVMELCYCGVPRIVCGCAIPANYADKLGSTAIVTLLTPDQIIIGNCGDSGAFLSRGGAMIALTSEHTLAHQGEYDRINAAGGKIILVNGEPMVMGEVAVTRSIGVDYLKPLIISKPETVVMDRARDDEFIIIASASVWKLVSVERACQVVRRILTGANVAGGANGRCEIAASRVQTMALGRQSANNLTVIVVDLRR